MADDLQTNLESYRLQLQQVDAALISDPNNDELIKLKVDLGEVMELTKDLLEQQGSSSMDADDDDGDVGGDNWKVGDKCMAPWSQDGNMYEAVIEEIHSDGKVSIGFTQYSQGDITELGKLKPYEAQSSKSSGGAAGMSGGSSIKRIGPKESLAERKQALLKQKEYLKKRKQKKQARLQEMDHEREKEKKKWLNFSTKKGLLNKKKSIFASPETVDGRVGIGTCGVSGKKMTEFSAAEKWRKGWK